MSVTRTFIGMVEAGEPLIRQALEAILQAADAEASGYQAMRYSAFAYWRIRCTRLSLTFSF